MIDENYSNKFMDNIQSIYRLMFPDSTVINVYIWTGDEIRLLY